MPTRQPSGVVGRLCIFFTFVSVHFMRDTNKSTNTPECTLVEQDFLGTPLDVTGAKILILLGLYNLKGDCLDVTGGLWTI